MKQYTLNPKRSLEAVYLHVYSSCQYFGELIGLHTEVAEYLRPPLRPTEAHTFFCPKCGNRVSAMPCRAIGCPRCVRPIRSRLGAELQPSPAMPLSVPFGQPPPPARRGGTPGIVVAMLLYVFFPVGLYLLWTHPAWTDRQKWKYTAIWLTIILGLFAAALLASVAVVTAGI